MSLNEEERATLVGMYLNKAHRTLQEAEFAVNGKEWGIAANRMYYALFHAATALFVHDGVAVGTHRGIKALFGQQYILTGKFPNEHARLLAQMETLRDKADYDIMFVASESDVCPNIEPVKAFIRTIETYLQHHFEETENKN